MKYATFKPDGTLDERLIDGLHNIPPGAIEVSEELWSGLINDPDSWVLDDTGAIVKREVPLPAQDFAFIERSWRDDALQSSEWLTSRHRDEQDMQLATTLTAEQFADLLVYRQALRDWPQAGIFPDSTQRPVAPAWIAEQVL